MVFGIEFCLDGVARTALPPGVLGGFIFGVRVAALDHEAFDDAVKTGAVVKAFLGELLEVFDMARREVRVKLQHHGAFAGFDDGYFLGFGRLGGGGVGFGIVSLGRGHGGEQAEGAE